MKMESDTRGVVRLGMPGKLMKFIHMYIEDYNTLDLICKCIWLITQLRTLGSTL